MAVDDDARRYRDLAVERRDTADRAYAEARAATGFQRTALLDRARQALETAERYESYARQRGG